MPQILMDLGDHVNDPQPIQVKICLKVGLDSENSDRPISWQDKYLY